MKRVFREQIIKRIFRVHIFLKFTKSLLLHYLCEKSLTYGHLSSMLYLSVIILNTNNQCLNTETVDIDSCNHLSDKLYDLATNSRD
jgi:hypothetical protein